MCWIKRCNVYGINGGMMPRWDCRYILHDLITKDADISICLEGSKLVMNCYDNAESLFDIEPFCWKLFAVKSPIEIEQVEIITGDDRQTVNV